MSLVLQEISRQYIATNNGLEQVYQNKLVEGRDYERWDWLKYEGVTGTGDYYGPYIVVGSCQSVKARFNINPEVFGVGNQGLGLISYIPTTVPSKIGKLLRYESSTGILRITNQGSVSVATIYSFGKVGGLVDAEVNNTYVIVNGVSVKRDESYSLYVSFGVSNRSLKNTSISNVFVDSKPFYPCKLLSPCPVNLSANGKAYPIGECGMIDSVSGKFYGNSGSGSFSVYNDPVTE